MSESIGPQICNNEFWIFMLGVEHGVSAIVFYVTDYFLISDIGVVSIHPRIGCELWIDMLLAVLDLVIFSEDSIVRMLFLDDDAL